MKVYVKFKAIGNVLNRNKDGDVIRGSVKRVIHVSGIVKNDRYIKGRIFQKYPDLLPCDTLDVDLLYAL